MSGHPESITTRVELHPQGLRRSADLDIYEVNIVETVAEAEGSTVVGTSDCATGGMGGRSTSGYWEGMLQGCDDEG